MTPLVISMLKAIFMFCCALMIVPMFLLAMLWEEDACMVYVYTAFPVISDVRFCYLLMSFLVVFEKSLNLIWTNDVDVHMNESSVPIFIGS